MRNEFDSKLPIYQQIVYKFAVSIARGELAPGSKVASVRDLALEFSVNPNTMQKSLAKLEEMGLLYTERTSGRYVTQNQEIITSLGVSVHDRIMEEFVAEMVDFGVEIKEIPDRVSNYIKKNYIERMDSNGKNTGN